MFRANRVLSSGLPLLLAAGTAQAGGFATTRFGGEHGHAATDHVTAIFHNPAGMALGSGTRIYLEGLFAYRAVEFTRDPAAIDEPGAGTPDDGVAANSGKNTLGNFIVSPFAGVVTDFGVEGLGVGLSLSVPFGGQAKWDHVAAFADDQQYPGGYDGAQRWSAIEGSQRSIYISLGGAWAPKSKKFAIGAAANLIRNQIFLVRGRNVDGTDNLVTPSGGISEGRSLLDVGNFTFSAAIGAMLQVTPCFRLGLSYQSQPGFGETGMEGTLTNKFGSGGEATQDVVLRQSFPDSVRFGGEWKALARASFRASLEYTRWSVLKNQCLDGGDGSNDCSFNADGSLSESGDVVVNIRRNWQDNVTVRAGGSWWPMDDLELTAGALFDSNAIPDRNLEPAITDAHKVLGTLGATYSLGRFWLEGSLAHVYYLDRDTDPRGTDPMVPSRNPDMAGKYHQSITYGVLGVGVQL